MAGWITSLASGLSSLVKVVARLSVVREVPGSIPGAGSWSCYNGARMWGSPREKSPNDCANAGRSGRVGCAPQVQWPIGGLEPRSAGCLVLGDEH